VQQRIKATTFNTKRRTSLAISLFQFS